MPPLSLCVMVTLMKLFKISNFLTPCLENFLDTLGTNILLRHQYKQMIKQITDLLLGVCIDAVFRGNDDFAAFLAAFFQYLVKPLFKQVTSIGAFLRRVSAAENHVIKPFENIVRLSSLQISLKKQLCAPV